MSNDDFELILRLSAFVRTLYCCVTFSNMIVVILTSLIILTVLFGPILLRPIEGNVELFFLGAGTLTSVVCGRFGPALIVRALREPLALTSAVLVFGIIFRLMRTRLDRLSSSGIRRFGQRRLCFGLTIGLGLLSGSITAVVAALAFAEAIALLKMDRSAEIAATVFGCFAIGIGAVTTPLGMPASALVLVALHARFWYLALLLWPFIIVGIVLVATPTLFLREGQGASAIHLVAENNSWAPVIMRAAKVYIFIVGLVGLSASIRPIVDAWLRHLPGASLFWINTISAVLDNATLAAIEIGPALNISQQRFAILGLLISGGILIPGNIPNIVAAGRLGITSREWAAHARPPRRCYSAGPLLRCAGDPRRSLVPDAAHEAIPASGAFSSRSVC